MEERKGMSCLRPGIVGCGAVTRLYHLPAAARLAKAKVTCLVDINLAEARRLAKRYRVPFVTANYRDLLGRVDAAIVATPNHLHAPISAELLTEGIHVLCEKPLALSLGEAEVMINAARKSGVVLAAGHIRRFFPVTQFVRRLINGGVLGEPNQFVAEQTVYDWPATSNSFVDRRQAGGGILVDTGSHTLDQLLVWFGTEVTLEEYRDDSLGGVEADCIVKLRIRRPGGEVSGVVELSKTRELRNSVLIRCEKGSVEAPFGGNDPATIHWHARTNGQEALTGALTMRVLTTTDERPRATQDYFLEQVEDFADSILSGREPKVRGEAVLPTIALIEECYQRRLPLLEPWSFPPRSAL